LPGSAVIGRASNLLAPATPALGRFGVEACPGSGREDFLSGFASDWGQPGLLSAAFASPMSSNGLKVTFFGRIGAGQ